MDNNVDYNNFQQFNSNIEQDPFFNPMLQYEQGYMYYKYLSQQMDYRIKCKEYEKLCGTIRKKVE